MSATDTLRALLAEATRGPWSSGHNEGWDAPRGYHVWLPFEDGDDPEDGIFVAYTGRGGVSCADAKLIVAAVNALPALLDVVEAALLLVDVPADSTASWKALEGALARLDGAS